MAERRNIKVICVMVASLNGKITSGTDPYIYTWTSKEDQEHFFQFIEQAECIIMGRNTYEHAKGMMKHKVGRLRVVLTSNPVQYKDQTIPNQLEFTNVTPSELLSQLEERGFTEVLLLGGSSTNAAFLKENCIDELILTIEPVIFGTGTPLFTESIGKQKLTLISTKKLNDKGTLLLHYSF